MPKAKHADLSYQKLAVYGADSLQKFMAESLCVQVRLAKVCVAHLTVVNRGLRLEDEWAMHVKSL